LSTQHSGAVADCLDNYDNQALTNAAIQFGVSNAGVSGTFPLGLNLYGFCLQNNAAAVTYFQFWDKAGAAPTVGTTAPTYTFMVPANSTLFIAPERALLKFVNAAYIACTTARANGTAPATAATVDVWYSQR
jgi:hypothetical protein